MKDASVPLKTILQNFINHVETLEARLKENDDLYESEFQVRQFIIPVKHLCSLSCQVEVGCPQYMVLLGLFK